MMAPRFCKAALAGLLVTALFQVTVATPIDGLAPLVAREEAVDAVQPIGVDECSADAYNCCRTAVRLPKALSPLYAVADLLDTAEALLGVQCAPIDLLGLVSGKCKNKPLCCKHRDVKGLLGVACTPIRIDPLDAGNLPIVNKFL
ncbi:hypothetical protein HGRIS_012281 [Hohenbuehelia grisea]|uniref:Hydrophobin n=1 Tax=Hohenbuehelia grisea TaxID=104357 RepID=A0ABR3IRU4_9AGAR